MMQSYSVLVFFSNCGFLYCSQCRHFVQRHYEIRERVLKIDIFSRRVAYMCPSLSITTEIGLYYMKKEINRDKKVKRTDLQ